MKQEVCGSLSSWDSGVEKQLPAKQGLKLSSFCTISLASVKVEKQLPAKQGLKPCPITALAFSIPVEKQLPAKQGLKHSPLYRYNGRSYS
ncbi:hypothetical protein [Methanosarcina lacustris]